MYVWAVQTSGIALNLEIIQVGEHCCQNKTKIHLTKSSHSNISIVMTNLYKFLKILKMNAKHLQNQYFSAEYSSFQSIGAIRFDAYLCYQHLCLDSYLSVGIVERNYTLSPRSWTNSRRRCNIRNYSYSFTTPRRLSIRNSLWSRNRLGTNQFEHSRKFTRTLGTGSQARQYFVTNGS